MKYKFVMFQLALLSVVNRELAEKFPSPETYILLGDAYMSIQEVCMSLYSVHICTSIYLSNNLCIVLFAHFSQHLISFQ